MEETSKNPIQVSEKLFQVIETLADNGPMGIMELSAALGFHKSTTHRLVTSLQCLGYVRQEEDSLKYALSLRFLQLGSKIIKQTNVATLIHPLLRKISEQVGETVHLVRREGNDAVYIDKVESGQGSIRMASRVGNRIPLYCSGVGKALLAEMEDEEIEKIWKTSDIRKLTEKTIVEFDELKARIARVREDGYVMDDEENEEGVRCLAVSLHDYHKVPVYAMSVSGPVHRMTDERICELREIVLGYKTEMAKLLGVDQE